MGKTISKKTMIFKNLTSVVLVFAMMIGMVGVISKKVDAATSQDIKTVTFSGDYNRTVYAQYGSTLGWVLDHFGIEAPRGYNYTFKTAGGTGINRNYTITSNETFKVTKSKNSGQVILHNLGSPSGSPRILNVKTGDKLSSYISEKSDYSEKYLLAVTSSVQYGGKKYFHPKYTPALVIDPSEPRQEFTGIWIGKGQTQTITYTLTKDDVKSLKKTVEEEITSLKNGQWLNRIFTGAIITVAKAYIFGKFRPTLGPGDPSTTAAIKEMERLKTLCDTALSQNGSKYAMKVEYKYNSSSYHAVLEVDVDCKIISFNKIG